MMRNNQIQLPRLRIYLNDFREARKYAAYILEKGLCDKKETELRELVRSAFNTSLIISYSHPFGWNKEFEGQPQSRLKEHAKELLSENEVKLHNQVIAMRNSTYAHSQASSHLIEGFNYSMKRAALMCKVPPLNKAEVGKLKNIIEEWIKYLEAEKSKLKGSERISLMI